MSDLVVQSSMIASANYDSRGRRLHLVMRDGRRLACHPVPPELFGHFLIAQGNVDSFARWYLKNWPLSVEAAAEPAIAEPAPRPSHQVAEDDCCSKPLYKAIATGRLDKADSWIHDKCGCEWRSRIVGGVIQWTPVTCIQIF